MEGQACVARGDGNGPCVVRRFRSVIPSQEVPEGVSEGPEEAEVAGWGGGAAQVAVCAWLWGLSSPRWEQQARRCAAPRQNQSLRLQGRAVCGSRRRKQRGHAVAGGWWYLWTGGGVGAWGLVARACWWACVWCLWCSCVLRWCCVQWVVRDLGGGGGSLAGCWVVAGGIMVGRTAVWGGGPWSVEGKVAAV